MGVSFCGTPKWLGLPFGFPVNPEKWGTLKRPDACASHASFRFLVHVALELVFLRELPALGM